MQYEEIFWKTLPLEDQAGIMTEPFRIKSSPGKKPKTNYRVGEMADRDQSNM